MHGVTAYVFLADRSPQTDAALTGFPVDDAWIHLVYGRSLAQHGVPAFNDSTLEAGFSSPAWIAVTGGAHLLAHDPRTVVLLVKIAGVLAALLGSVAIARLCHHLTGAHWPGLYAGALAGLTSFLAFAQVSGMEPLLAGALALWALVAALRRKPATAGALLAAAYLARPETLVLAPCLVLPFVLRSGAAPASTRRGPALLRLLLPVVLAAAAWALYCLAATGRPLPNTYYVKSVGQQFLAGSWVILRNIVWELPCNWLGSGAILFALGLFALWRSRRSEALPVVLFPFVFLLALAATRPMPPDAGVSFYFLRYAVPGLLPLFVPIAIGAAALVGGLGGRRLLAQRGAAVLLVAGTLVAVPQGVRDWSWLFSWSCQNINEVQVEVGKWLREHTPPEAGVAVIDAGAARYFGERRTTDLLGLNDHRLAQDPGARFAIVVGGDVEVLLAVMQRDEASHLVIFPKMLPGLLGQDAFRRHFEPVAEFVSPHYVATRFPPQDTLAIYRLRTGPA